MAIVVNSDNKIVMTDNRTSYTGVFFPAEGLLLIKEEGYIRYRFTITGQEAAYRFYMQHFVGREY